MSGRLYLIGTPLGNLGDMSPRAVETLGSVDLIAAEDTRVTVKLLNHFGIKKPMVSYYEHNRRESGERLLEKMLSGGSVALVTDAGMPAISDPGEDLVRLCAENGIEVLTVPGGSALISALALSGLPTQRFCFEGFLSTAKKSRLEHLDALKTEKRTMIFYEAPHKLLRTLEDMLQSWGDRRLSISRELTKLHEETIRTSLAAAIEHFSATAPRGELVLVIEGAKEQEEQPLTAEQALELVERYRNEGLSLKQAAKLASEDSGISKNELYQLAVKG